MKKIVITAGLISGVIASTIMGISMSMCASDPGYEGSMLIGYASMVLAFSLIFVAVKNYRDKQNGGVVSFGKALSIGLLIAFIASTMYVLTWAIMYNYFLPDFMDKYTHHMVERAQQSGDQKKIAETMAQIQEWKDGYKNPVYFTLITYAEIFPVGLIVSLIAAAILRKNDKSGKLRTA
ncbi:DUF4199 domain-containing protein [Nemorincola caseinilytica]|uniref:DUF4199 domain-containing protein n=1 Tax=Nemorincola caseinilytica TaxID=2054315 RepID=A0ABP8N554_9BACT